MNFEFVKELSGLNKVFKSCANAEELALSKPDLSMIASRKSAEVLAKFVFITAHAENIEDLTFADVLVDPVVKRYINSTPVLDAFHYIRKKGNAAVHTLEDASVKTAVEVLKQLHYVTGEIAKRMKLITKYPTFDVPVVKNESAQPCHVNVDDLAQEMYDDYVVSRNHVKHLLEEFSYICGRFRLIPGDVDLNECIEFKNSPKEERTISYIQEYFAFLAIQAIKAQCGQLEDSDIEYSAELVLYGENGYTTTDLCSFVNGIMYDLPKAKGFKITSIYHGPSVAPWFDGGVREEFCCVVTRLGKNEEFTYTKFEFLYNHGMGGCSKYENGTWIDLELLNDPGIVDHDFGEDWFCWNLDLGVKFDFEKYPEIVVALQDTVRKHIPADQLGYCEDSWESGDLGILVSSIAWSPRTLRVVQDFLDEVNAILEPIKSECDCWAGDGVWNQVKAPFAVAKWVWTEEGFVIHGTVL